jgi:hypothetical protein
MLVGESVLAFAQHGELHFSNKDGEEKVPSVHDDGSFLELRTSF